MPILELTDEQVIDLVRQLPPERQRAARTGAGRWGWGAACRTDAVRRSPTTQKYSPSVGSTGTRWSKTSARH